MQLIKSGIIVSFYTLLSRILGYIRDVMMASYLGLNSDSFIVAFRLPNTFRSLFAEGAFSAAFVPTFTSLNISKGKEQAIEFADKIYTILFLILFVFVGFFYLFMPQAIAIIAPGFHGQKLLLAEELSYYTIPYLIFIALVSLYSGILNSFNKFAITAFVPIILNIVMIFTLQSVSFFKTPSHALAVGVLLAGIIQLLVIIFYAKKNGFRLKFVKISFGGDVTKMFANMIPAIIGSGVVQLNLLIDTIIVSYIDGAASILYYADRLNQFPLALIGTALGTVLLPNLTKEIKLKNFAQANLLIVNSIEIALFFSLPCVAGYLVLGEDIVKLLFVRGNFVSDDSIKVYHTLCFLALGFPAFVLIKVLTPRFYAAQDTKTPVKISLIGILINTISSLILINYISFKGVALSTSISAWINVILIFYIQNKNDLFKFKLINYHKLLKLLPACMVMSLILVCVNKFLVKLEQLSLIGKVLIEIFVAILIYILTTIFFKIYTIKQIAMLFEKRKVTND